MSNFALIAATKSAFEQEQTKLIESVACVEEPTPLIESLYDEFKKVLTKLKDRQSVDLKTVAGYMAGIDLMTNPEHKAARQELVSGGDLGKLGIQANIVDPRSINTIDQNKAVRDGLAILGWKHAQSNAQQYYHMLQDVQRKGNVGVAVPVMQNFLKQLKNVATTATKPASVGIKQQMQQTAGKEAPVQDPAMAAPAA